MNSSFKKLFLFLLLMVYQSDGLCQSDMATCLGFDTPSLSIQIHDAMNNEIIETAGVHVRYQNAPDDSLTFDNEKKRYFSYLAGSAPSLFVEHPGYQDFRNKDLGFVLDVSCGGKNEWFYTVYLCPLGKDCAGGLKSHMGFSDRGK